MFSVTLFFVATLVTFLTLLKWVISNRRYYKLGMLIPGAGDIPILDEYLIARRHNYEIVGIITELFSMHPSENLVRFWRGSDLKVIVRDPEYLQAFYTGNSTSERGDDYDLFDLWLGQVNILTSKGEQYKQVKRLMFASFNGVSSERLMETMSFQSDVLIQRMRDASKNGWFQFEPLLLENNYALLSRVTMDENMYDHKDLFENLHVSDDLIRTVILKIISPMHFFNLTFPWTRSGRRYIKNISRLRNHLTQIVRKKVQEYKDALATDSETTSTYVNLSLSKCEDQSLGYLTDQVITLFSAAVDTTSIALNFCILMLGMHQDVQERLYEEDKKIMADLAGGELTPRDLQDYEYLDRFIKETLRIFPAFPSISRAVLEDTKLGDYIVPKGATMIAGILWSHRLPEHHKEPLKFDPDRFLPENMKNLHPFAYTPFSAGPKSCIGVKFANMSLKIALSRIVRNFKVFSEYSSIAEVDQNIFSTIGIYDKRHITIRIENRT